jgi:tetratricopeptide (TPR) repeat protein
MEAMMTHLRQDKFIITKGFNPFLFLFILLGSVYALPSGSQDNIATHFTVRTFDGSELPAQVIPASAPFKKLLIFIQGSTPYDQFGNEGPGLDENGAIIKQKNDFYNRFMEVMPAKGYALAMMAKRSFIYPQRIPRPTLDELALDIRYFIEALKKEKVLLSEDDLVIVGYSEGSTVATKVLGLLKNQPSACVLLGSACLAYNYKRDSWQDWYRTDLYRRKKNWTDEQLEKEFNETKSMVSDLLGMDEQTFEKEYKHSKPYGFGFAPWESYHIDKEVNFYDPTANVLAANTSVLICIGDNDMSMPLAKARTTYQNLLDNGFEKATLRVIKDEVHQYKKYDVFAIINAWLESAGTNTDYVLTARDQVFINKYTQKDKIGEMINSLPWGGGQPEKALESFSMAKNAQYNEAYPWYKLGLVLFPDGYYEQALYAFSQALDTSFVIHFAAMVWVGHIKDLQNQRAQAIEWYNKALQAYPGFPVQHDNWHMKIDRAWIDARLQTPFTGIDAIN